MNKIIKFREAHLSDARLIYGWRNDSLTRKMSLNTEKIDYESHFSWFSNMLTDKLLRNYICIIEDDDIGSIRVHKTEGVHKLNWMISPDHRGNNYGFMMLNEFLIRFKDSYIAEIKEENIASINLAIKSGMKVYKQDGVIITLKN